MQSPQPTGEHQAQAQAKAQNTGPTSTLQSPAQAAPRVTQSHHSPTARPSLPSPLHTSAHASTSPTSMNQVVVLPRPRGNIFASNKPIPPITPEPIIEVNSRVLSETHQAIHQALRDGTSGIQVSTIQGAGKRLVRRTTPVSPLAGSSMVIPSPPPVLTGVAITATTTTTPSPGGKPRNTVHSPFKVPSPALGTRQSLETVIEDDQPKATENQSMQSLAEEEKIRNAKQNLEVEDQIIQEGLNRLEEEDGRDKQNEMYPVSFMWWSFAAESS